MNEEVKKLTDCKKALTGVVSMIQSNTRHKGRQIPPETMTDLNNAIEIVNKVVEEIQDLIDSRS